MTFHLHELHDCGVFTLWTALWHWIRIYLTLSFVGRISGQYLFSEGDTFYLSGAVLYEHFREKLSWADTDYEVLDSFQALKLLTIWSKKPLLRFCKQIFAAVCLLPLEFLLWKIFFWHGSNSPTGPSSKRVFRNCLQFIFASCWRVWTMSNTINILEKFLQPFMASWPKNTCQFILSLVFFWPIREVRLSQRPCWQSLDQWASFSYLVHCVLAESRIHDSLATLQEHCTIFW